MTSSWPFTPWFVAGRALRIVAMTGAVAGLAALLPRLRLLRNGFRIVAVVAVELFAAGFSRVVVAG